MTDPHAGFGAGRLLRSLALAVALVSGCATIKPAHPAQGDAGRVITAEQIRRSQATNVLQALERTASFLSIHTNATGLHIIMRGPNSLLFSSDCLVVVDAAPLNDPRALASMPVEDVVSIRLLTGSEATPVYGTRGGAGVVEVHTRAPND